MTRLFITFLFLSLSSSLLFSFSQAQVIGKPPNITCIAGAFNFSEIDTLVSGSQTSPTVGLSITHAAGPSNIIYSTIGTFNFSETDNAVTSTATDQTNITSGTFQFTNIGGSSANSLSGQYSGTAGNAGGTNSGVITSGTGAYQGATGSIFFNNTQTAQPTQLSATQFSTAGITRFMAVITM